MIFDSNPLFKIEKPGCPTLATRLSVSVTGNPAVSVRPVAFRPLVTQGLAFPAHLAQVFSGVNRHMEFRGHFQPLNFSSPTFLMRVVHATPVQNRWTGLFPIGQLIRFPALQANSPLSPSQPSANVFECLAECLYSAGSGSGRHRKCHFFSCEPLRYSICV